ncbi:MAG: DUF937 domain-containing protein, partial [Saprospiraceae bacterium]
LNSALDRDHDGSALNDIFGMLSGMSQPSTPATDGLGILGHIFGNKQDQVAQKVSSSSGLNLSQIMKLMPILAPIVMGLIGKLRSAHTNQSGNSNTGSGGFDLARILMGSVKSAQEGGFGDLIGSVLGGVMSGNNPTQQQDQQQQGGGLFGKILGAIFKGK